MVTRQRQTELLVLCRTGDRDAFGDLAGPCYDQAVRMAVRAVSCQHTAQDLVQEALLEAWLSLASFREDAAFGSWLFGIVLNLCRAHLRRRKPDVLSLDSMLGGRLARAEELVDRAPAPDEVAEEQELQGLVRSAIETLAPRARRATALFYLESLSLREIAAVMGISVGTVKAHLHKGRRDLRDLLRECAASNRDLLPGDMRPDMTEVFIWDIIETQNGSYLVILEDPKTQRVVPLSIGNPEGTALVMGLRDVPLPRPITHNLMVNMLEELGVELKEIRIEKLIDETFYAVLSLQQGKDVRELDCRPSDAMCLAVRTGSPIYVANDVLDAVDKVKGDLLEIEKDGEAISIDGTGIDAIAAAIEEKTGKAQTIRLPRDR